MFTKAQLKELEEVGMYKFISNNKDELTKEEIIYLLKEFVYNVYEIDEKVEFEAIDRMIKYI